MSGLHDDVRAFVAGLVAADVGAGDMTSEAVVPKAARAAAVCVARTEGVVSGLAAARAAFEAADAAVFFEAGCEDGDGVVEGATLFRAEGVARALLAAERTAMNLLGHLSGVATATAELVREVEGTNARILHTRKTTPGAVLGDLERAAVTHGGGRPHRRGLDDQGLLKENHFALSGLGVEETVALLRERAGDRPVGAEATDAAMARACVRGGADYVLLDNLQGDALRDAVAAAAEQAAECGRQVGIEVSGGIRPGGGARSAAESGADRLSSGWITHSAPALDLSLLIEPLEDRS